MLRNLQPCISTIASASMPRPRTAFSSERALRFVERDDDLAVRANSLGNLDHRLVRLFRQHDLPSENVGPSLIADAQGVAEPARDRQRKLSPLRSSKALVATVVPMRTSPSVPPSASRMRRDALDRRVLILVRVVGKQLLGPKSPGPIPGDDVRERPTSIDREIPNAGHAAFKQMPSSWGRVAEREGISFADPSACVES